MKISIITVCFNSEKTIERTINSVINQHYSDFEYIIIDGGSNDSTLSIINKWQKVFPIKLISEPDNGIYDVMNKGVKFSSGEFVLFLNSDDYFYSCDSLSKATAFLDNNSDIVYGSTEFRYDGFSVIRKPSSILNLWKKMPFNHQSSFTRRELLIKHPFVYDYKLASDYEFLIYAYKNNFRFKKIDVIISSFGSGGISNKQQGRAIREYEAILKKYNLNNLKTFFYYRFSLLKPILKKITSKKFKKFIYNHFVK